jgi:O-antigen/teichoic acid export membrane protein
LPSSVFSRFFAGTVSIGFARVSLIVFGLITVMIAVRYVSPEEYGAFVLLQVILTFLTEFTSFGLTLTIPQSLASTSDPIIKRKIINTAIWFRFLTVIAVGILILVFRFALDGYKGSSIWSDLLLYLPLLLILGSLESTFETILQGLFKFNLIGILGTIGILINLILTLIFIVYLKLGVLGLIYAKLIPIAVQLLIAVIYSRIEIRLEFSKETLQEMLVFGFPLQLQYILGFAFSRVDTVIIASMLGTSGIAYYEVARRIPDNLNQLFNSLRSVYFPLISELNAINQQDKALELLNTSIRGLSFLTLLCAIIAVTFGKDIIHLLFSDQYLISYPLFVLLMIGLSLNIVENTLGYSLTAIGEPDKPLYVNIARGITSTIGNLLVIPIIGIIGAPLINLFSNIIATPMDMFFLAKRKYYVQIRQYIKPLIIFGVNAAIFYLLNTSSFLIKLGVTALFIVSCFILSVITKEDLLVILGETKAMVFRFTQKNRAGNVRI